MIWYIWWLAILGLLGSFVAMVWYAWRDEHEHVIPVDVVRANARERRRVRQELLAELIKAP
jgi:cytochrome o ubiquinol oxidase subunit 1